MTIRSSSFSPIYNTNPDTNNLQVELVTGNNTGAITTRPDQIQYDEGVLTGSSTTITRSMESYSQAAITSIVTLNGSTNVVVRIELSNDGINWLNANVNDLDTTFTSSGTYGFTLNSVFQFIRFNFVSESGGSNATISVSIRLSASSSSSGTSTSETQIQTSNITSTSKQSIVITREANTTPYAIDDVWGNRFNLTLPITGDGIKSVILTRINLITSLTSLPSGFGSFRLFLFQNTTDSGNILDNNAFTARTTSIDVDGYLLNQILKSGNDAGGRSTTFDLNIPINIDTGVNTLYGYLVTTASYTPTSATADTITIKTHWMVA
jgi:hypothetical protein